MLEAFSRYSDVQYRFLAPLQKALTSDRERVLTRARSLAKDEILRTGKEVCNELIGLVADTENSEEIKVQDRTVAIIRKKKAKGETIEFSDPLGGYRKQEVISAVQALFLDAVMQTGVVKQIDACGSVARVSNCES